jgi:hypothetical protein
MADRAAHVEDAARLQLGEVLIQVSHHEAAVAVVQRGARLGAVHVHAAVIHGAGEDVVRHHLALVGPRHAVDVHRAEVARDVERRVGAQRPFLPRAAGDGPRPVLQRAPLALHTFACRIPDHLLRGTAQRAHHLVERLLRHHAADFVARGFAAQRTARHRFHPALVDEAAAARDLVGQVALEGRNETHAGMFVMQLVHHHGVGFRVVHGVLTSKRKGRTAWPPAHKYYT